MVNYVEELCVLKCLNIYYIAKKVCPFLYSNLLYIKIYKTYWTVYISKYIILHFKKQIFLLILLIKREFKSSLKKDDEVPRKAPLK